jgi:hypothetical protein
MSGRSETMMLRSLSDRIAPIVLLSQVIVKVSLFGLQLMCQAETVNSLSSRICGDLRSYSSLEASLASIINEAKASRKEHFHRWTEWAAPLITTNGLQQKTAVMSFDKAGKLCVAYSDELSTLVREVEPIAP